MASIIQINEIDGQKRQIIDKTADFLVQLVEFRHGEMSEYLRAISKRLLRDFIEQCHNELVDYEKILKAVVPNNQVGTDKT